MPINESVPYVAPTTIVQPQQLITSQQPAHTDWVGPAPSVPLVDIEGSEEYIDLLHRNQTSRMGFVESISDWGVEHLPWWGDAKVAGELISVGKIFAKLNKGETPTDEELVKLNIWMQTQQRLENATTGGKVADVLKNQLKFGVEIGAVMMAQATILGDELLIAKMVGDKAAKEIAKETAEKAARGFVGKAFSRQFAGKLAKEQLDQKMKAGWIDAVENFTGSILKRGVSKEAANKFAKTSYVLASTGLQGTILSLANPNVAKRQIAMNRLENIVKGDDEDANNAVVMGFADSVIEHWSEVMGTDIGKATGAMLEKVGAKALAERIVGQNAINWLAKQGIANIDDAGDLLKAIGVGGFYEEFMEERFGGFMRGLLGVEGDAGVINAIDKAIPSAEQAKVEAIAFSIPGLVGNATTFGAQRFILGTAQGDSVRNQIIAINELKNIDDSVSAQTEDQLKGQFFGIVKDEAKKVRETPEAHGMISKLSDFLFAPASMRDTLNQLHMNDMIGLYNAVYERHDGSQTQKEAAADKALVKAMSLYRQVQVDGITNEADAEKFNKMVEEGVVEKLVSGSEKPWAFQYVVKADKVTEENLDDLLSIGMINRVVKSLDDMQNATLHKVDSKNIKFFREQSKDEKNATTKKFAPQYGKRSQLELVYDTPDVINEASVRNDTLKHVLNGIAASSREGKPVQEGDLVRMKDNPQVVFEVMSTSEDGKTATVSSKFFTQDFEVSSDQLEYDLAPEVSLTARTIMIGTPAELRAALPGHSVPRGATPFKDNKEFAKNLYAVRINGVNDKDGNIYYSTDSSQDGYIEETIERQIRYKNDVHDRGDFALGIEAHNHLENRLKAINDEIAELDAEKDLNKEGRERKNALLNIRKRLHDTSDTNRDRFEFFVKDYMYNRMGLQPVSNRTPLEDYDLIRSLPENSESEKHWLFVDNLMFRTVGKAMFPHLGMAARVGQAQAGFQQLSTGVRFELPSEALGEPVEAETEESAPTPVEGEEAATEPSVSDIEAEQAKAIIPEDIRDLPREEAIVALKGRNKSELVALAKQLQIKGRSKLTNKTLLSEAIASLLPEQVSPTGQVDAFAEEISTANTQGVADAVAAANEQLGEQSFDLSFLPDNVQEQQVDNALEDAAPEADAEDTQTDVSASTTQLGALENDFNPDDEINMEGFSIDELKRFMEIEKDMQPFYSTLDKDKMLGNGIVGESRRLLYLYANPGRKHFKWVPLSKAQQARIDSFREVIGNNPVWDRQFNDGLKLLSKQRKRPSNDGNIHGSGVVFYAFDQNKKKVVPITNMPFKFANLGPRDTKITFLGANKKNQQMYDYTSALTDILYTYMGEQELRYIGGMKYGSQRDSGRTIVHSNRVGFASDEISADQYNEIARLEYDLSVNTKSDTFWFPVGKIGEKDLPWMARMPRWEGDILDAKLRDYIKAYRAFAAEHPDKAHMLVDESKIKRMRDKGDNFGLHYALHGYEWAKRLTGNPASFKNIKDMGKRLSQLGTPGPSITGPDVKFDMAFVDDEDLIKEMPMIDGMGFFNPSVLGPHALNTIGSHMFNATTKVLKAFGIFKIGGRKNTSKGMVSMKPALIDYNELREYDRFKPIIEMFDANPNLGVVMGASSLKVNGANNDHYKISKIWEKGGGVSSSPEVHIEKFDGTTDAFYVSQDLNFEALARERFDLKQADMLRLELPPDHLSKMWELEDKLAAIKKAPAFSVESINEIVPTDPKDYDLRKHGTIRTDVLAGIPAIQQLTGLERQAVRSMLVSAYEKLSKLSLPRFINVTVPQGESNAKRVLFDSSNTSGLFSPFGGDVNVVGAKYTEAFDRTRSKEDLKKNYPWIFKLDPETLTLSDEIDESLIFTDSDGNETVTGQPYMSIRIPASGPAFMTPGFMNKHIGGGEANLAMSNSHVMWIKGEDADGDLTMGITMQRNSGNQYDMSQDTEQGVMNNIVLLWWQASRIASEARSTAMNLEADPKFLQKSKKLKARIDSATVAPWNSPEGQADMININTVGKESLGIMARSSHSIRMLDHFGMRFNARQEIRPGLTIARTQEGADSMKSDAVKRARHHHFWINGFINMFVDDIKEQQAEAMGFNRYTTPFISVFAASSAHLQNESELLSRVEAMSDYFLSRPMQTYVRLRKEGVPNTSGQMRQALRENGVADRDIEKILFLISIQNEMFDLSTIFGLKTKLPHTVDGFYRQDPLDINFHTINIEPIGGMRPPNADFRRLIPSATPVIPFLSKSIDRMDTIRPFFANEPTRTPPREMIMSQASRRRTAETVRVKGKNKFASQLEMDRVFASGDMIDHEISRIVLMNAALGNRKLNTKQVRLDIQDKIGTGTPFFSILETGERRIFFHPTASQRLSQKNDKQLSKIVKLTQDMQVASVDATRLKAIHDDFDNQEEQFQDDMIAYTALMFGADITVPNGGWLRYVGPAARKRLYRAMREEALRWEAGILQPGEIEYLTEYISLKDKPHTGSAFSGYEPFASLPADVQADWAAREAEARGEEEQKEDDAVPSASVTPIEDVVEDTGPVQSQAVGFKPPANYDGSPEKVVDIPEDNVKAQASITMIGGELANNSVLNVGASKMQDIFTRESAEMMFRLHEDRREARLFNVLMGLEEDIKAVARAKDEFGNYPDTFNKKDIVSYSVFDPKSKNPEKPVAEYPTEKAAKARVKEINKSRKKPTAEERALGKEASLLMMHWKELPEGAQADDFLIPVGVDRKAMTPDEIKAHISANLSEDFLASSDSPITDRQRGVLFTLVRYKHMTHQDRIDAELTHKTFDKMNDFINEKLDEASQTARMKVPVVRFHNRTAGQIISEWDAAHPSLPFGKYKKKTNNKGEIVETPTPDSLLAKADDMLEQTWQAENEYLYPWQSLNRTEYGKLTKNPSLKHRDRYVPHEWKDFEDKKIVEEEYRKWRESERARAAGSRKYSTFYEGMVFAGLEPKFDNFSDAYMSRSTNTWAKATQKAMFSQMILSKDVSGEPLMLIYSNLDASSLNYDDGGLFVSDEIMDMAARQYADYLNAEAVRTGSTRRFKYDSSKGPRREMNRLIDESRAEQDLNYSVVGDTDTSRKIGSIDKILAKKGTPATNVLTKLVERPDINRMYKFFLNANEVSKELSLGFSGFHYFALAESWLAFFGLNMKNPGFLFKMPQAIKGLDNFHKHTQVDKNLMGKWVRSGLQASIDPPDYSRGPGTAILNAMKNNTSLFGPALRTGANLMQKIRETNGKWLWETWLPAMKISTAERIFNEVRRNSEEFGYAGVSDEILREHISQMMNDGFGGQDFNQALWYTPAVRNAMKLLVFAPDWTISALNIALSPIGINLTNNTLKASPIAVQWSARKYWPAMAAIVMWGLPNILQTMAYLYGLATGTGDPDDRPFIAQNEINKNAGPFGIPGMGHIDVTPFVRTLPFYKGDPTGERRVYIRFAKQATEIFEGWVDKPIKTALGKMSPTVKTAWEQISGSNTYGWDLDFKEISGPQSLIVGEHKGMWGGRVAYIGKKFLPMSILSWLEGRPTTFVAPASRGMSKGTAQTKMAQILDAYADDRAWSIIRDNPRYRQNLNTLFPEWLNAVERNGYDPVETFSAAKRKTLARLYNEFFTALNKKQDRKLERIAEAIIRVHGTIDGMQKSMDKKYSAVTKEFTPELKLEAFEAFVQ